MFQGHSPSSINSYARLKISVKDSFLANSSCGLQCIQLKLCKYLHHDVEQCILFQGTCNSPPDRSRVMSL